MSPWLARGVMLAAVVALVAIPALVHRGRAAHVARSDKGVTERLLLALVSLAFLVALVWIATPLLAFADHPLHPAAFGAGIACLIFGLWLLWRSHADLGASWSITLELRQGHRLVTRGVYARVRHPMYAALLLYAAGQALVLPNWLAGPAYLAALVLLVGFRIGPEERMMREGFADAYDAYRARTGAFLPRR